MLSAQRRGLVLVNLNALIFVILIFWVSKISSMGQKLTNTNGPPCTHWQSCGSSCFFFFHASKNFSFFANLPNWRRFFFLLTFFFFFSAMKEANWLRHPTKEAVLIREKLLISVSSNAFWNKNMGVSAVFLSLSHFGRKKNSEKEEVEKRSTGKTRLYRWKRFNQLQQQQQQQQQQQLLISPLGGGGGAHARTHTSPVLRTRAHEDSGRRIMETRISGMISIFLCCITDVLSRKGQIESVHDRGLFGWPRRPRHNKVCYEMWNFSALFVFKGQNCKHNSVCVSLSRANLRSAYF